MLTMTMINLFESMRTAILLRLVWRCESGKVVECGMEKSGGNVTLVTQKEIYLRIINHGIEKLYIVKKCNIT